MFETGRSLESELELIILDMDDGEKAMKNFSMTMLIKYLRFVCSICIFYSVSVLADQAAWISEEEAKKALNLINQSDTYISFCQPCGDREVSVIDIKDAAIRGRDVIGNYFQVFVNNKGIDLAYTYIKKEGRWTNLAQLLNIKVTGVERYLSKPLQSQRQLVDSSIKGFNVDLNDKTKNIKFLYDEVIYAVKSRNGEVHLLSINIEEGENEKGEKYYRTFNIKDASGVESKVTELDLHDCNGNLNGPEIWNGSESKYQYLDKKYFVNIKKCALRSVVYNEELLIEHQESSNVIDRMDVTRIIYIGSDPNSNKVVADLGLDMARKVIFDVPSIEVIWDDIRGGIPETDAGVGSSWHLDFHSFTATSNSNITWMIDNDFRDLFFDTRRGHDIKLYQSNGFILNYRHDFRG